MIQRTYSLVGFILSESIFHYRDAIQLHLLSFVSIPILKDNNKYLYVLEIHFLECYIKKKNWITVTVCLASEKLFLYMAKNYKLILLVLTYSEGTRLVPSLLMTCLRHQIFYGDRFQHIAASQYGMQIHILDSTKIFSTSITAADLCEIEGFSREQIKRIGTF